MTRLYKYAAISDLKLADFLAQNQLSLQDIVNSINDVLEISLSTDNDDFIHVLNDTYKLLLIANNDKTLEEINAQLIDTVNIEYLFKLNKLSEDSQLQFIKNIIYAVTENEEPLEIGSLFNDLKSVLITLSSNIDISNIIDTIAQQINFSDTEFDELKESIDSSDKDKLIDEANNALTSDEDIHSNCEMIFNQISMDDELKETLNHVLYSDSELEEESNEEETNTSDDTNEIDNVSESSETNKSDTSDKNNDPIKSNSENTPSENINIDDIANDFESKEGKLLDNPKVKNVDGKYDISDVSFNDVFENYDIGIAMEACEKFNPELFKIEQVDNVIQDIYKYIDERYQSTLTQDTLKNAILKFPGNRMLKLFINSKFSDGLLPLSFLQSFIKILDKGLLDKIIIQENSSLVKSFTDFVLGTMNNYSDIAKRILNNYLSNHKNYLAEYEQATNSKVTESEYEVPDKKTSDKVEEKEDKPEVINISNMKINQLVEDENIAKFNQSIQNIIFKKIPDNIFKALLTNFLKANKQIDTNIIFNNFINNISNNVFKKVLNNFNKILLKTMTLDDNSALLSDFRLYINKPEFKQIFIDKLNQYLNKNNITQDASETTSQTIETNQSNSNSSDSNQSNKSKADSSDPNKQQKSVDLNKLNIQQLIQFLDSKNNTDTRRDLIQFIKSHIDKQNIQVDNIDDFKKQVLSFELKPYIASLFKMKITDNIANKFIAYIHQSDIVDQYIQDKFNQSNIQESQITNPIPTNNIDNISLQDFVDLVKKVNPKTYIFFMFSNWFVRTLKLNNYITNNKDKTFDEVIAFKNDPLLRKLIKEHIVNVLLKKQYIISSESAPIISTVLQAMSDSKKIQNYVRNELEKPKSRLKVKQPTMNIQEHPSEVPKICDNMDYKTFANILTKVNNLNIHLLIDKLVTWFIQLLDVNSFVKRNANFSKLEILNFKASSELRKVITDCINSNLLNEHYKITNSNSAIITQILDIISKQQKMIQYVDTQLLKNKNNDLSLRETKQLSVVNDAYKLNDRIKDTVLFNVSGFFNNCSILVLRNDVIVGNRGQDYKTLLKDYFDEYGSTPQAYATGIITNNNCVFITSYGNLDKNEVIRSVKTYLHANKVYFKEGTRNMTLITERIAKRLARKIYGKR